MSIQAIVFDFGNVIGLFDKRRTTHRLLPYSTLGFEELHAALLEPELEDAYESGRLTDDAMLAELKTRGCLSCGTGLIADAWSEIFWPNAAVCDLIPGLACHYPLILGSNTNSLHARRFLPAMHSTFQHFRSLILSHQIGARKPRPAFYEACVREAGCAPGNCLFVDDLPANVAGARNHGMKAVLFRDLAQLLDDFANYGIRHAMTTS